MMGVVLVLVSSWSLAEEVPPAVLEIAPELQKIGLDPVLVAAVKAQNSKGRSLDAIKQADAKWRGTEGIDSFMQSLMDNEAAQALRKIEKSQSYYLELFLMDNQGANVAMTGKTSDYWQGDEAKWTESFKGGAGAVHVGEVEFDESAQAYLVQVSVPVMDAGVAIGAVTIGINLDELE
ncbi:hypothetical protein D0544_01060 [Aestuariirhabdus litorea]|uniref:Uncharacterized protein n=2 Tax=Aestuariirhabdus litorea TaxID=2528527 RepID=A0A3P3VSV7_9GAMM|nr:hypothetical protein D0544_01060 [Aestuariirhabdus litorea]RWW98619.1 hypothetical protein DZC74_01060 [Endozoicomonadaceae bacterium GTF-13]